MNQTMTETMFRLLSFSSFILHFTCLVFIHFFIFNVSYVTLKSIAMKNFIENTINN